MFLEGLPEGRSRSDHDQCSRARNSRLSQEQQDPAAPAPMTARPVEPGVTLFVCVTCKHPDREGVLPGRALYDAVEARLADAAAQDVALRSIACLSVCKRPCTVAMTAPGKWTYVVGDLDAQASADDVLDAARKFAATADGIIPWRERPLSFRKGVVSRTPPLALAVEEV